MTIYSGIFNSINGDRKYNAWWFAKYFATFIGNGVFPNPSTGLQVMADERMQVKVRAGSGWIDGYFLYSDDDYILELDKSDGLLKRIDRIVMRLNHTTRQIEIAVKKGTFASTPVAPTLQRDGNAYELALADVFIANGATQITQANVTDTRLNKTLCGIVHGVVDQVDATAIFNQYQAWFENQKLELSDWLADLQYILDGDVAANLAGRIVQLENWKTSHNEDFVKHTKYVTSTYNGNIYNVTITELSNYVEGLSLAVKVDEDSTDATRIKVNNLAAIPVVNSSGEAFKKAKAGAVYTVRYTNGNFILQGEGGSIEIANGNLKYSVESSTFISDAERYGDYQSYYKGFHYVHTGSVDGRLMKCDLDFNIIKSITMSDWSYVQSKYAETINFLNDKIYITFVNGRVDVYDLELNLISTQSSGYRMTKTVVLNNAIYGINNSTWIKNVYKISETGVASIFYTDTNYPRNIDVFGNELIVGITNGSNVSYLVFLSETGLKRQQLTIDYSSNTINLTVIGKHALANNNVYDLEALTIYKEMLLVADSSGNKVKHFKGKNNNLVYIMAANNTSYGYNIFIFNKNFELCYLSLPHGSYNNVIYPKLLKETDKTLDFRSTNSVGAVSGTKRLIYVEED